MSYEFHFLLILLVSTLYILSLFNLRDLMYAFFLYSFISVSYLTLCTMLSSFSVPQYVQYQLVWVEVKIKGFKIRTDVGPKEGCPPKDCSCRLEKPYLKSLFWVGAWELIGRSLYSCWLAVIFRRVIWVACLLFGFLFVFFFPPISVF